MNENDELFVNRNTKVIGQIKIEAPKNIWIDEFICLRSKMYRFKREKDSKNKLKGNSKHYSKNIKFDEYIKRLDGREFQQERDDYFFPSLNHEMYLQRVKKSALSQCDDKQCYESNIKNKLWER